MDLSHVTEVLQQFDRWLVITIFTVIAGLIGLNIVLLVGEHEGAVPYDVAVPEQCKDGWEGQVLEEPSIKVGRFFVAQSSPGSAIQEGGQRGIAYPTLHHHLLPQPRYIFLTYINQIDGSTAVQCYCPASGQLLGIVNPVTADGIDRIISKAKDAQIAWAETSFAERRTVLRALLK